MALTTYSFLDIVATFSPSGGGGQISLGFGAGIAKEGLSFEMLDDKDLMTIGADGAVMHSLRASNGARCTVRILKTSPTNNFLSTTYGLQRFTPSIWGQNFVSARDILQGDVMRLTSVAFARQPVITYAEDANLNEWTFYGTLDELLGQGIPDLAAVA
jgi:Protein of unknown function (DUF3277)